MINFIICEDNQFFNKQFCYIIDKVMMKNDLEYQKHIFYEFNDEFKRKINENIPNKVYILDIVMPNADGTEIAGLIRQTDLDSLIIFITSYYDEYEFEMLNGEYMFLKFIDKATNYQQILSETLENAIKRRQKKILTINMKDTIYRFNSNDVTYINYSKKDRKTYINFSFDKKIPCNLSLKKINSYLDSSFVTTKSCCIVNIDQINTIDKVNKIIKFNNREEIDMLSKKGMQALSDAISNQNYLQ